MASFVFSLQKSYANKSDFKKNLHLNVVAILVKLDYYSSPVIFHLYGVKSVLIKLFTLNRSTVNAKTVRPSLWFV